MAFDLGDIPPLGQMFLDTLSAWGFNHLISYAIGLIFFALCMVIMAGMIANTLLTNGGRARQVGGRTIPPGNRTAKAVASAVLFVVLTAILYFTMPLAAVVFFVAVCGGVIWAFAGEGPAAGGY